MLFPEIKFVKTNTLHDQLDNILRECREAHEEENDESFLLECLDVVHAAETLRRILENKYGVSRIEAMADYVFDKNDRRGYYDE